MALIDNISVYGFKFSGSSEILATYGYTEDTNILIYSAILVTGRVYNITGTGFGLVNLTVVFKDSNNVSHNCTIAAGYTDSFAQITIPDLASFGIGLLTLTNPLIGSDSIGIILVEGEVGMRYWVANTQASYNSAANWSLSSGGPAGAPVPDSTIIAVFDSSGTGNCLLDTTVNTYGFYVTSGYSGTITQQVDSTVNIGLYGALFDGGRFIGNQAPINMYGSLFIDVDFTSTNNILSVWNNCLISSTENFYNNSGTVKVLTTGNRFAPGGARFYNLMFDQSSQNSDSSSVIIDASCYVENDLFLINGYLKQESSADGTINLLGDLYCEPGFGLISSNHNAVINLNSDREQRMIISGGILPHLTIDKTTSNQVINSGTAPIHVNGDLTLQDGTLNTGGLDIIVGI